MFDVLLMAAVASAQTVEVDVHGVTGGGQIGCALFVSEAGFPDDDEKAHDAVLVQASTARNGVVTCRFDDVAASTIAVTVMHDRNGNGELDTNLFGIPREPYGFSNDAELRTFGPPRFSDARVPRSPRVHIHLRD